MDLALFRVLRALDTLGQNVGTPSVLFSLEFSDLRTPFLTAPEDSDNAQGFKCTRSVFFT